MRVAGTYPYSVRCLIAAAALTVCALDRAASGDPSDVSDATVQFSAIAVPYWVAAEGRMGQMYGTYSEDHDFLAGAHLLPGQRTQARHRVYYEFDAKDLSAKDVSTAVDDPSMVHAFAINPDNQFSVMRHGDQAKYRVTDFRLPPKHQGLFFDRVGEREQLYRVLAAESLDMVRLAELGVGRQAKLVKAVRFVQRPEGPRVQLDCEVRMEPASLGVFRLTAILNPAIHWAVERWESRRTGSGGVVGEVTFQTVDGDLPFPKTYAWQSTDRTGKPVARYLYTFDPPTVHPPAADAAAGFTLPAFGLPVPGTLSRGSWSVILGATGFVVLGIVLAVVSRRGKAKVAA